MDNYIKQSIDSRRDAIANTYELGAGDKKKIDALFSEIEKLGTSCQNVQEFEAEFAKSPLSQKYLDLFTELAKTAPMKGATEAKKPKIGKMVAEGVVEGAADRALDAAEKSVLPTRAAVHQEVSDAARKVPVLGDAIDIGQKASYAAHLGKLFGGRKNKKDKKNKGDE